MGKEPSGDSSSPLQAADGGGAAPSAMMIVSLLKTCLHLLHVCIPTAQHSAWHMINILVGGIIMYYSANNDLEAPLVCNYQSMTEVMGTKHTTVRHGGVIGQCTWMSKPGIPWLPG